MTDSDREKRIEVFHAFPARDWTYGGRSWAERAIDRLDRAVPVVPLERAQELERERDEAVAAARACVEACDHVSLTGRLDAIQAAHAALEDLRSFLPPDREE